MNDPYNEEQYVTGQFRPTFKQLFEEFEAWNQEARDAAGWLFDMAYGSHPRQTFDLCLSAARARGLLLYFHAGYWQSRDKRQFHFLAPGLNKMGYDVAFVNYPLCPEVSVGDIVASVLKAPAAVAASLPADRHRVPLVVCGHSAGAHLAVELALAAEAQRGTKLDGIVAISGVYDLAPLVGTSLNVKLRLSASSARAFSPLWRARSGLPPAYFIVGGGETAAFHRQSQDMADTWTASGNASHCASVAHENHFTVLQGFSAPDSALGKALDALVG